MMAIFLCIETSTSGCSAALHENGNLIDLREIQTPYSAASQLVVQIEHLFLATGISKKSVDAVAVSAGPGSYTGLRIGTATAKGICFALDRPLITIDSLHVLASAIRQTPVNTLLCPMIDARRMEVYCCLLTGMMEIAEDSQARVVDETSFFLWLAGRSILYFGNGADKCRSILHGSQATHVQGVTPNASEMGKLTSQKYHAQQFADVHTFEPNYLKEFVAKTKSA